ELQAVLDEARQQVAGIGRHVEVGTEHLLLAMTIVDTPIREVLREFGVGVDSARQQSERHSGETAEPINAGVRLNPATAPATDRADLFRILDASANRAREGLRVIEDYVRFALNDRHLAERTKECRHQLAEAMGLIPLTALLASRDTRGDVGTTIHSRRELHRNSLTDVVRADFKRVQEACRALEEYGKAESVEFSRAAGQVRYAAYTLERAVMTTVASLDRLGECPLYLILTESLCPRGSGPVLRGALAAGVRVVQVREKTMRDRELLAHARRVREWTAEAGCLMIMNDRPDLAALVGADGVHVGQEELPVAEARRIVGPDRLVGLSTHDPAQAREAVLDGADYIGVGPVFSTTTKNFQSLAGLDYVRQVSGEIELPGFCIGGIHLDNIDQVIAAGGRRVAVSSAICSADDPEGATHELLRKLRRE
ncbi:MAG: thiamine phosphate synthase, partial [Planctomycetota bacterium]|nr:thiamine phosphate synthase [Planctomycetota bacterium]